jgi:hypothetical protein
MNDLVMIGKRSLRSKFFVANLAFDHFFDVLELVISHEVITFGKIIALVAFVDFRATVSDVEVDLEKIEGNLL